ncbi:hypothetical protein K438DRAFT_1954087 [Mycena galopus ATCC 62051]|nr:hypothetical protein K438DRAFT_1954087 [Mycena galopus ATCC 62051]
MGPRKISSKNKQAEPSRSSHTDVSTPSGLTIKIPGKPALPTKPTTTAEPASRTESTTTTEVSPNTKKATTEVISLEVATELTATPTPKEEIRPRPSSTPRVSTIQRNPNAWGIKRRMENPEPTSSNKKQITIMEDSEARNKLAEYEREIEELKADKFAAEQKIARLQADLAYLKDRYDALESRTTQEYDDLSLINAMNESDINNRVLQLEDADRTVEELKAQLRCTFYGSDLRSIYTSKSNVLAAPSPPPDLRELDDRGLDW